MGEESCSENEEGVYDERSECLQDARDEISEAGAGANKPQDL